ncbi:MAG: hypothetical protein KBD60_12910 [Sterolibacterium sp.]|nr:hypothetical protein [Sterolibacterium sp.]
MTATVRPAKKYIRTMSATERFSLAINELYRYNIVALAEGTGNISRQQLQDAVEVAAAHNPGARVRLKSWLGWTKWVDSGIAPQVHEIQTPDWDCNSERGADFMDGSFDTLSGGPVCDLYLIPGEITRIVVRVLHAAMDARGLQHFVKDIFRVLRGESPIGSDSTLTDQDVKLKFQDKIQGTQVDMECMPILKPSTHDGEALRYIWRRAIVERNISSMLPKMAIFLAQHARQRTDAEGDVGFTIPVDLRGLREDIHTTANMTGYLRVKVTPDLTAKNVMQQINQGIKGHLDCTIPPIFKWVPWIPLSLLIKDMRTNADKLLYAKNKVLPSGGIVSMGMFKPEDYSCPQFQATTCIGIPGSVGKMNVVIMNHTDHTEVVFSTPAAYNKDGQLDQLIEDFRQAMRQ